VYVMAECLNLTAPEVKLIRKLVNRVGSDGIGTFTATNLERPILDQ
jgi:hypothetical protein